MRSYTLHRLPKEGDWRQVVIEHLVEHLRAGGHQIQVRDTADFELRTRSGGGSPMSMRDSLAILEDDQAGALRVLDFHDWPDPWDIPHLAADPRLKVLLRCQYMDGALRGHGHEAIRPWTYFDGRWPSLEPRLEELRRRRRTQPKLHFRGHLWKEREPLIRELQRRELLDGDVSSLPYEAYLDELASYRVILSLPGMGDLCHRDMEAFAIGSCVLRTTPRSRLHDPLVANHHFISVPGDAALDPPEEMADRIERRFRQLVQNAGYLGYVAHNAQQWYDRNVRLPASMRLTESLLELER